MPDAPMEDGRLGVGGAIKFKYRKINRNSPPSADEFEEFEGRGEFG